jgi:hypothetical protein
METKKPVFGVTTPPTELHGYKARNAAELAAGRHPATGKPLLEGHKCRECVHHRTLVYSNSYHKCELSQRPLTHGPSTDIQVAWPACTLFEASPPQPAKPKRAKPGALVAASSDLQEER